MVAIRLFPPSKISYGAIVLSGNTTERNSKDLPLLSVVNIAVSSLYTWTGATPHNNLWACLLLKTPTETYTSYSALNFALHCANSVPEGNAVPAYINVELLTLIVSFYIWHSPKMDISDVHANLHAIPPRLIRAYNVCNDDVIFSLFCRCIKRR